MIATLTGHYDDAIGSHYIQARIDGRVRLAYVDYVDTLTWRLLAITIELIALEHLREGRQ
jgi:hypothetical protein